MASLHQKQTMPNVEVSGFVIFNGNLTDEFSVAVFVAVCPHENKVPARSSRIIKRKDECFIFFICAKIGKKDVRWKMAEGRWGILKIPKIYSSIVSIFDL